MNKKYVFVLLLVISILLNGCTTAKPQAEYIKPNTVIDAPENVIREFFASINTKELLKINSFLSNQRKLKSMDDFNNIDNVKIISIAEINDDGRKYNYFHGKIVSKSDIKNIKVFNVKFDIKYKNSSKESMIYEFILIREKPDSQWIIRDFGF